MSPVRVVTPFFEIGFERDEVDRVAVGLSFLLLDVDEFDLGFCLSDSSGLFDRRDRFSAGMVRRIDKLGQPRRELWDVKVEVSI
jgi:hypothetical protein